MSVHVSISDDVTTESVAEITAAAVSGSGVVVVHESCTTIAGRRRLSRRLKSAGCLPAIVHSLGWATATPEEAPTNGTIKTDSSRIPVAIEPDEPEPASDGDMPVGGRDNRRKSRKGRSGGKAGDKQSDG